MASTDLGRLIKDWTTCCADPDFPTVPSAETHGDDMTDHPLEKLGPYKVEGVVGRGGMGSVFAARHELTHERSAIKVLAPALAADESFRERFIAEIESLKTLNHPSIVKLHGYGESEGHLYYAMELVEGTNLEQELSAGRRFNWREVTQLGIDIARALKHAHDHGVIHRDLKPANLLMDHNEQVKLTDFGIAKLFGASRVTYNGGVLGTADYMAPEQAAGEPTTPRCDLYSLGCVMYALLAGVPPFKGKSVAEVVHKVRYEQHAPLSKFANDVPRDLQLVIDELLEKDPEDRIRTALSLMHRLRAIQQALSISTTAEDAFSSDSLDVKQNEQTSRIVNPPPDIAERPTVFLPTVDASAPTEKSPVLPAARQHGKLRNPNHFTRVELDQKRKTDSSRGEFSSILPLMLMLLIAAGIVVGTLWYIMLPPNADDLHKRIMAAAERPMTLKAAARQIDRFIERFPEDNRIDGVQELREEIAIQELQHQLEVRARGRKETGRLSPVEFHCNEAFQAYREGRIDKAIEIFENVQLLFGGETQQTDIGILRILEIVSRLLPQWREELDSRVGGLLTNLSIYRDRAIETAKEDPARAREIWESVIGLYGDHPWAEEFVREARDQLTKLKDLDTPSVTPEQALRETDEVKTGDKKKAS